eukprot:TRINITY_DN8584_c0_g2_i1.p1 TRINITY_DN8584_c0_g2~~TRINITY_DN8584_c0_g2_i1.p1  ORF type:complete len:253 (+),score=30.57 TRINITY_DN8584_c0_g2_i1:61-819(+)
MSISLLVEGGQLGSCWVEVDHGFTTEEMYAEVARELQIKQGLFDLEWEGEIVLPCDEKMAQRGCTDGDAVQVKRNSEYPVKLATLKAGDEVSDAVEATFETNPNMVLLLDVTDCVTCDGILELHDSYCPLCVYLPPSVKRLRVVCGRPVRKIGDKFLTGCRSLTHLDLSALEGVSTINHYFLSGCFSLHCLDLSPFASVTFVGRYFLSFCTSFYPDLKPLSRVTFFGDNFMSGCDQVEALDLSPVLKALPSY